MSEQSDRIPRTAWDDVNAILDDHAINFRFREPRSWDALRRAIIEAEAAAPAEPSPITDEQAEAWLKANDLIAVTHWHSNPDCAECSIGASSSTAGEPER